jgi:hypothetical protein
VPIESLFLFALLLVFSAYVGIQLSRLLGVQYDSILDCLGYAIGLGFVVIGLLGFWMGVLGQLRRTPILLATAVIVALITLAGRGRGPILKDMPARRGRTEVPEWVQYGALLFLAVAITIALIGALSPETVWDAHSYILNLPKRWVQAGRLVHFPYMFYSTWPHLISVIYAVEMLFQEGTTLPQLTDFVFGLLSLALIVAFVGQRAGKSAALLAGVAFYAVSAVAWLSTTAIADLAVCYYGILALVSLLRWKETGKPAWLLLAGIGGGAVIAAKIIGILPALAIAMVYLTIEISSRERRSGFARRAVYGLAPALIIALPWFVRAIWYTGNPVYPFLYTLFGGTYWNERVDDLFLAQQFSFRSGRRAADVFLVPIRLLKLSHFPYGGSVSIVLPVAFIWGIFRTRRSSGFILSVFALILYCLWFFFSSQQLRYLLPALGALSIVFGLMVSSLFLRFARGGRADAKGRSDRDARKSARLRNAAAAALLLFLVAEGSARIWHERAAILPDQLRVLAGRMRREEYLNRHFYLADVMTYINEELPDGRAILAFNEVRGYMSEREFIWGAPSLQGYIDYGLLTERETLLERFNDLGIGYVLINNTQYPTEGRELRPIQGDLELIYQKGEVYLYRISWDTAP